jgi:hypothetical protein
MHNFSKGTLDGASSPLFYALCLTGSRHLIEATVNSAEHSPSGSFACTTFMWAMITMSGRDIVLQLMRHI